MMSESFPVSSFWSCGFVPHRKWNYSLLYLSVHCVVDFIEQIKKFVIHVNTLMTDPTTNNEFLFETKATVFFGTIKCLLINDHESTWRDWNATFTLK